MDSSKKCESVRNQYIAACIINIMGFCHGCGLGWISPTLPTLMVPTAPLDQPLTTSQAALVSSILCVGAMPAAPFYGWLADHYGRKTSIVAAAFPYLACWLMKLLWRSALGLMTARFLAGVGASGLFMLCPLYASEVGTLGTRGVLGTLAAFSMNAGVVFMYVLATYASYSMVLMVMIPVPIVFLLLMTMMPETPAFLVKNNRINEAAKALAWLRRVPLDSGVVLDEINNLKKDIEISSKKTEDSKLSQNGCSSIAENNARNHDSISKWKLFIYSVPTRSAFLVCFSLLSIQACMGVYAVITFSTDIFTAAAGSAVSPSLSCIIVGLLQLIGSVLASFLIERLGRKILIICSSLAVSSAMGGMALYFSLRERAYDVSALGWAPVLALSVAVCAFSMGAGPVPYVLPSELFNVQARGLATSMLMTWAWFASFVITQIFSSSVVFFGIDVVFWIFSAMGLALISVSVFFLPETKGKTIAEVQLYYKKDKTQPWSRKQSEIGELL